MSCTSLLITLTLQLVFPIHFDERRFSGSGSANDSNFLFAFDDAVEVVKHVEHVEAAAIIVRHAIASNLPLPWEIH